MKIVTSQKELSSQYMEITGKIIAVLPERGGISQRTGAEWKVQEYVLETQEQYPRKMCFDVFGADKIAQFNIQIGEVLTVSFDVDAREYQGRWYNSIRAWKVDRQVAAPMGEAMPPFQPADVAPAAPVDFSAGSDPKDDLPF